LARFPITEARTGLRSQKLTDHWADHSGRRRNSRPYCSQNFYKALAVDHDAPHFYTLNHLFYFEETPFYLTPDYAIKSIEGHYRIFQRKTISNLFLPKMSGENIQIQQVDNFYHYPTTRKIHLFSFFKKLLISYII
jgi:hypothetical protein